MVKVRPCSVCGIEVSLFRIKAHERVCDGEGFVRRTKTVVFETDTEGNKICPDCGKKCHKNGAQTHWRVAHRGDFSGRPLGAGKKTGRSWNRGLTKETDERIARASSKTSEGIKRYRANLTEEEKKHWSELAKRKGNGKGGLRKGSGRGKKGWYEGYWCDSSWELAWVIYAVDHEIEFVRNTAKYAYEFQNRICHFYPDFILSDKSIVEIKGYRDAKNEAKIASIPDLEVIGPEEIKPYLKYAIQKFGTDFISSAYQQPPEHKCIDCGKSVSKRSPRCAKCARKNKIGFKIEWPSVEELKTRVAGRRFERVALELGVSSNAIRKHIRTYGLVAPM